MTMTREEILDNLYSRMGNASWILAVLKKEARPINKEKLGELTNQLYAQVMSDKIGPNETPPELIGSRHTLDQLTARLEGAGLVDVPDMPGRATFYQISRLGEEVIKHSQKK